MVLRMTKSSNAFLGGAKRTQGFGFRAKRGKRKEEKDAREMAAGGVAMGRRSVRHVRRAVRWGVDVRGPVLVLYHSSRATYSSTPV